MSLIPPLERLRALPRTPLFGTAPFMLRLAFRNLSRHRRRTALTIGALAVSVLAALLPSVSAARQSPAESLRYV